VCLLPLTHETRGILNREQLSKLPKGSALILCSRGEHLVVDDLVWREPGVLVTPHMAGLAKPAAIAKQISENIKRLDSGATLLNCVNNNLGY
jgi:glyoxylate/hydroxypyruvate reductase A